MYVLVMKVHYWEFANKIHWWNSSREIRKIFMYYIDRSGVTQKFPSLGNEKLVQQIFNKTKVIDQSSNKT